MDLKKLAGIGEDFTKFFNQMCTKYDLQQSIPVIEMDGNDKSFNSITIAVQFYPQKEIDVADLIQKNK